MSPCATRIPRAIPVSIGLSNATGRVVAIAAGLASPFLEDLRKFVDSETFEPRHRTTSRGNS